MLIARCILSTCEHSRILTWYSKNDSIADHALRFVIIDCKFPLYALVRSIEDDETFYDPSLRHHDVVQSPYVLRRMRLASAVWSAV